MSITIQSIKDLGFVPSKKQSPYKKTYDTLIYPLNKEDYLYIGYNPYSKSVNYKTIWKSFVNVDKERICYPVIKIGDTSFTELKDFIERSIINSNYKPTKEEQDYLDGKEQL